ncbi:MAG: ASCH domain-containing protein [Lachnospiraceae bacterium]|nr:ASCH domain-containing protein [Lachnospiraceae bacterium]
MKSVLISIQPKWCELIASGQKTVEVRKTAPKLHTPFKVYIYCTQEKRMITCFKPGEEWYGTKIEEFVPIRRYSPSSGRVIGEFVCSEVSNYDYAEMYNPPDWEESLGEQYYITSGDLLRSCLSYEELKKYGQGKKLHGLHISELSIYDKPKKLSEFVMANSQHYCHLQRPPQSWCYVEELNDGN